MAPATPLTVSARKFGIEPARQGRNNDEHEGLADSLKTLLQNIETNKTALLAKGQTRAETDQIQELYDALVKDSTAQGSSLSDQRLLTAGNVKLFRALYAPMKELLADGKSIYKTDDKTKLQDYTLRKILQQVRKDQPAPPAPDKQTGGVGFRGIVRQQKRAPAWRGCLFLLVRTLFKPLRLERIPLHYWLTTRATGSRPTGRALQIHASSEISMHYSGSCNGRSPVWNASTSIRSAETKR